MGSTCGLGAAFGISMMVGPDRLDYGSYWRHNDRTDYEEIPTCSVDANYNDYGYDSDEAYMREWRAVWYGPHRGGARSQVARKKYPGAKFVVGVWQF